MNIRVGDIIKLESNQFVTVRTHTHTYTHARAHYHLLTRSPVFRHKYDIIVSIMTN